MKKKPLFGSIAEANNLFLLLYSCHILIIGDY